MKIEIPDLMPEGLEPEFWGGDKEGQSLPQMLVEEGFGDWIQAFIDRTIKYSLESSDPTWTMWEGYWKATGKTQTLLVFGVLHHNQHFHPRAILTRNVKPAQLEATKEAMFSMFNAYMDQLALKLGNFGTGKTTGSWHQPL